MKRSPKLGAASSNGEVQGLFVFSETERDGRLWMVKNVGLRFTIITRRAVVRRNGFLCFVRIRWYPLNPTYNSCKCTDLVYQSF